MRDILHDEVDELEDLRERAQESVTSIKSKLPEIARKITEEGGTMQDVFEAAAVLVENDLAGITTKAVKSGLKFGKKRAEAAGADKPEK